MSILGLGAASGSSRSHLVNRLDSLLDHYHLGEMNVPKNTKPSPTNSPTVTKPPPPTLLPLPVLFLHSNSSVTHSFAHDRSYPILDPLLLDPTVLVHQLANVHSGRLGGQSQQ